MQDVRKNEEASAGRFGVRAALGTRRQAAMVVAENAGRQGLMETAVHLSGSRCEDLGNGKDEGTVS